MMGRPAMNWDNAMMAALVRMRQQLLSQRECAYRLGVDVEAVTKKLQEMGINKTFSLNSIITPDNQIWKEQPKRRYINVNTGLIMGYKKWRREYGKVADVRRATIHAA
jgi:hypothetical protein